jgi:predicted nuclease with TOPRIM domain
MKDLATLVSGIDYKMRKLIEHHQQLRTENEKNAGEIRELKATNGELREKVRQLEEKIKILKLAKTLENKEGNVEAKLKINELVREIDKCIGLLNT